MQVAGIMIGSDNPKALGEFYAKVLGKPGWEMDDWCGWREGAQLTIGGHSEVKGKNETPARLMINMTTDDVKGEFDRIKALGATVVAEPYQPNADRDAKVWLATFADPDGNYFQLSTPWE